MINKVKKSIQQWIHLNIMLILMMFVIRIFFFVETTTRINIEISQFANIILGFKYDLLLASHFIAWISLIFLIFHYFFPKTTVTFYKVLIFIYAIISILLKFINWNNYYWICNYIRDGNNNIKGKY